MKKKFEILLIIMVTLLFLFILKDINFLEVYYLINNLNLFYFTLAFLSCLVTFLLWNIRWQNTLKELIDANYWYILIILFAGVFFNTITPGASTGGEPIRAYFLSKKYNKPKIKLFGSIAADKFFNLAVFLLFVVFSIVFIFIYVEIAPSLKIILEIILASIIIFSLVIIFFLWKKIKFKADWISEKFYKLKSIKKHFKTLEEFKNYVNKKIKNFLDVFNSIILNKKKFWFGIFISIIYWLFLYLSSYFLFVSLNSQINFLSVIIVVTLGYLIGDISPIPGGIGLTEGTMFLLYSAIGVPPPIAIVVSLLSRIIYYFFSLLIGGLSLIYLRFTLK